MTGPVANLRRRSASAPQIKTLGCCVEPCGLNCRVGPANPTNLQFSLCRHFSGLTDGNCVRRSSELLNVFDGLFEGQIDFRRACLTWIIELHRCLGTCEPSFTGVSARCAAGVQSNLLFLTVPNVDANKDHSRSGRSAQRGPGPMRAASAAYRRGWTWHQASCEALNTCQSNHNLRRPLVPQSASG